MGLARSRLGRQESRVLGFLRRRRHERLGYELYGAAVAAARQPVFYSDLRVPDTLDGRFDLVGLHVFLVIRRLTALPPPGPDVAQAVFDAMFSDMDFNLREMGVSDLVVGRRVKAMWEALHGRSTAYEAAMAQGGEAGEAALTEALARNVWRGAAPGAEMPGDAARRLARLVLRHAATLEAMPAEALLGGGLRFEVAEEALA
jgi:cytochrome b pre-mRNA-processing protein 3